MDMLDYSLLAVMGVALSGFIAAMLVIIRNNVRQGQA